MSRRPTARPSTGADVREAKGAAREAIGKLIGDDAEIRKGRAEQKQAAPGAAEDPTTEQE